MGAYLGVGDCLGHYMVYLVLDAGFDYGGGLGQYHSRVYGIHATYMCMHSLICSRPAQTLPFPCAAL